jgi:surface carbohydrate biosynthesis protein
MVKLFKLLKNSRHHIVAFDEEATAFSDENTFVKQRVSIEAINYLDKVFTWGNYHRNLVLSKIVNRERDIISTGHPRLDILKPEYRKLFEKDIKKIKLKFKSYILICSNVSANIYREEEALAKLKRKSFITSKSQEDDWRKRIEYNRYKKNALISLGKKIAYEFPNLNIIMRPHYPDSTKNWSKHFKGIHNVYVIKEGDVTKWLAGAMVVIQSECTTGLQACLLRVPLISYKISSKDNSIISKDSKGASDMIKELGYQTNTEEDAVSYIKSLYNLNQKQDKKVQSGLSLPDKLHYFYANIKDNQIAANSIIKEIDRLSKKLQTRRDCHYKIKFSLYHFIVNNIRCLLRDIFYFVRYVKHRGQNEGKMRKRDIQHIAKNFLSSQGKNNSFKIKRLDNEIFFIKAMKNKQK